MFGEKSIHLLRAIAKQVQGEPGGGQRQSQESLA